VVDQKWQTQSGTPVAKDRFKYAYDRASNRLYRTNEVAANHAFDELYHANGPSGQYDGLDRLTGFRRGTLTDTDSDGVLDTVADNSTSRRQEWTLDPVGRLLAGFANSLDPVGRLGTPPDPVGGFVAGFDPPGQPGPEPANRRCRPTVSR
jgi:hypothetical protein